MTLSVKVLIPRENIGILSNYYNESLDEIVTRFKLKDNKSHFVISSAQLRKLGEFFGLSTSLLLSEKVPLESLLTKLKLPTFRSQKSEKLSYKTIKQILKVYYLRDLFSELNSSKKYKKFPDINKKSSIESAKKISEYLSFESLRKNAKNPSKLLTTVRKRIEEHGILTFTQSISTSETRGISIANGYPKIIILTDKESISSRLFTLFHELGHILLNKPGISDPNYYFTSVNPIESWCDKFSAEILYPRILIENTFDNKLSFIQNIKKISKLAKGSKGGVAYNLKKYDLISDRDYMQFRNSYDPIRDQLSNEEKSSGGRQTVSSRVISSKGYTFTYTIINALSEERITDFEAIETLEIKLKSLETVIDQIHKLENTFSEPDVNNSNY